MSTGQTETPILTYAGEALSDARALKAPIVQWLPAGDATRVHTPHAGGGYTGSL